MLGLFNSFPKGWGGEPSGVGCSGGGEAAGSGGRGGRGRGNIKADEQLCLF